MITTNIAIPLNLVIKFDNIEGSSIPKEVGKSDKGDQKSQGYLTG